MQFANCRHVTLAVTVMRRSLYVALIGRVNAYWLSYSYDISQASQIQFVFQIKILIIVMRTRYMCRGLFKVEKTKPNIYT